MGRMISIHEYELKPGLEAIDFEQAIKGARDQGMLQIPGLRAFHFLRGVRGNRRGRYAAIWIYESREAWEELWGSVGQPIDRESYSHPWKVWEDEVLAPFLVSDPDAVLFTAYEVF
jgi:hypothetical protein